jgi:hypothetical protein
VRRTSGRGIGRACGAGEVMALWPRWGQQPHRLLRRQVLAHLATKFIRPSVDSSNQTLISIIGQSFHVVMRPISATIAINGPSSSMVVVAGGVRSPQSNLRAPPSHEHARQEDDAQFRMVACNNKRRFFLPTPCLPLSSLRSPLPLPLASPCPDTAGAAADGPLRVLSRASWTSSQ